MRKYLAFDRRSSVIISVILTVLIFSSCSSNLEEKENQISGNVQKETNQQETQKEEIPEAIKKVFPEAQSFVKRRNELSQQQFESIEKDTGTKLSSREHYSYLAFTTKDGKRVQLGAATLINISGKDLIIVYESKDGMPTIKQIRFEGLPEKFLAQFVGKNHDSKIKFGEDIKANGVSEEQAKTLTQAVRADVLIMEAIYGKPHSH
jgi:outer membrane murein-binding lipoprotein Lpp